MQDRQIFAHSVANRDRSFWETLEDHSNCVAQAARLRAEAFNAGDLAAALGLAHDLGKIKPAFQRKLAGEKNDAPHSAEGARFLAGQSPRDLGRLLAFAVAGHHGRLPLPHDLDRRLSEAELVPQPKWMTVPPLALPAFVLDGATDETYAFRVQFFLRMLYSCLTDADDRETRDFYRKLETGAATNSPAELAPDAVARFDVHMASLGGASSVNDLRREVLAHACAESSREPGLFTLTVPTGGGKTLTSLGFGLRHAAANGLRRLIYVVPYTSIVEQTADTFRSVLGREAVLENHSAFDWEGEDESEAEQLKVAAMSWDRPVVVTTAVQFFESLYAARKKRCRKLHSLARSVIVIDEAQTMPAGLLRPCLSALSELMRGYGASVVLMTATQPALARDSGFPAPETLQGARELAPDPPELYRRLKRVQITDIGPQDDAALVSRMQSAHQALLIVDNRVQARGLFDALSDAPGARHLSTLMTAGHRRRVLAGIRADLDAKQPVRLVSTSLIEAGVDVSFPLVMRSAAGIDSIAQAAGRCNRHGEMDGLGQALVFQSEHEVPEAIKQFAEIGRKVLAAHDDPLSLDAVAAYFRQLWITYGADGLDVRCVGELIKTEGILKAIKEAALETPFPHIEAAFQIIPGGQRAVVIAGGEWGVPLDDLDELKWKTAGAVARAFQSHTVNVPHGMWRDLMAQGAVYWWEQERFGEQFALLGNASLYNDLAGLGIAEFENLGSQVF